jgi:hypothetical protein
MAKILALQQLMRHCFGHTTYTATKMAKILALQQLLRHYFGHTTYTATKMARRDTVCRALPPRRERSLRMPIRQLSYLQCCAIVKPTE